jgi:hypothetical protein
LLHRRGRHRFQEPCAELHAMCAIVVPFATRLDEFAGRDRCRMADDGDEIALAARLYAQNAEAVLAFSHGFEP